MLFTLGQRSSSAIPAESPQNPVTPTAETGGSSNVQMVPIAEAQSSSSSNPMQTFLAGTEVTKSEIRWMFKMVLGHFSFNSCTNISELFTAMFDDSEIAKKFKLGPDKARYVINYGLAP